MSDEQEQEIAKLEDARTTFLENVPAVYTFTSFISTNLTTEDEVQFLRALLQCKLSRAAIISQLADGASPKCWWDLATFGVRRAITAVRLAEVEPFRIGLLPLLAGLSGGDWRDALRHLSVVEDCGSRLGRSAQHDLTAILAEWGNEKAAKICESYFARSAEMRDVRAMGLFPFGADQELWYQG
ncbi:hypothetical protein [Blastopirellula retiformator]|nr:hypothetical protein [Blastopirellula retiformator]